MNLRRWVTLPNLLSEFRIMAVPVLLALAWNDLANWFLVVLGFALLSDAVDGYIARRLHETSELGSRLDSWGDLVTFIVVPVGVWWLWPDITRRELPFIVIVLTAYLIPAIAGFIKFGRLPSYHTGLAKTQAVMISLSVFLLLMFDYYWPFRVFALVQLLVAMEEIAITLTLSTLRSNVRSYWSLRRGG